MYPEVKDIELVGSYEAAAFAGGGYVWDEVLEYRVWCYLSDGASDLVEGYDYYYSFESFESAEKFYLSTQGAQVPLALILQNEYIDEPEHEKYVHVKKATYCRMASRVFVSSQKNKKYNSRFYVS
ncbi:GCN5 family acetyltransferase [Parashewanella tropica]|uniref:GCN5 family acetyltransferase n=1 Tax=Parashewanella tropica TaxID=2547970 RepID=UPI001C550753|nr:GCN5 family acetyltransferase [Parashewanella tropica]